MLRGLDGARLYERIRAVRPSTVLGVIVGLVAAAALVVWLLWDFLLWSWGSVTTLPSEIAVPLVVAFLTALVSLAVASLTALVTVVTVVYSKRQEHKREIYAKREEHKREIAQQQQAEKAALYRVFMDYWLSVFGPGSSILTSAKKREIKERYDTNFPQTLSLWASEAAIREYVTYMRYDRKDNVKMFEFEQVLFAFRKDLGHTNEGLQPGDLLHLFVSGVEQALREQQEQGQSS